MQREIAAFRLDDEEHPIATGTLKVVYAVKPAGGGRFSAAPLPPEIDELLTVDESAN